MLKPITLSHWINPDFKANKGYVASYTFRQDGKELFTINLHKQMGFYQISEFVAPDSANNFIMEQTNKVGLCKIAAFDKDTGDMLGIFKGNVLVDTSEQPVFEVHHLARLSETTLCPTSLSTPDDYAAVLTGENTVSALFTHLPRRGAQGAGPVGQLTQWVKGLLGGHQDVMEIDILEKPGCDPRMHCAIAVILHSRRGLHLT